MEDALVPIARADRMIGVVANHVDHGLHEANAQGLRVLGHKHNVAKLIVADFADEFAKAGRLGEVERAAWLATMAVAPGNQRASPSSGELNDPFVFRPAAHGVE